MGDVQVNFVSNRYYFTLLNYFIYMNKYQIDIGCAPQKIVFLQQGTTQVYRDQVAIIA
jgi:hypothetical protein